MLSPTDKQKNAIKKIINHIGKESVEKYLDKFFPGRNLNNMTREQAQKIITGLSHKVPRKPVYRVYGRDVFR